MGGCQSQGILSWSFPGLILGCCQLGGIFDECQLEETMGCPRQGKHKAGASLEGYRWQAIFWVLSVVHTGNREFSCPHCTQRFGRKDHMTRHAKKTHANFYDSSERLDRNRLISTPLPGEEDEDMAPRMRTSRKERSISDPGPPVLLSRELKVPNFCTKVEPVEEPVCSTQQKVIEEFQKLVTQDTLDLVKGSQHVESLQRSVIVQNTNDSSSYIPRTVKTETGLTAGGGCRPSPILDTVIQEPVINQTGGDHNRCRDRFMLNGNYFPSAEPSDDISAHQGDSGDVSKVLGDDPQHRREHRHAKNQQTSNANEVLKFFLKEERISMFDNIGEEVRDLKELLAEKDSIDFNSFMNEITEEGAPIVLNSKRKMFLNPPSPPNSEESLIPKYLEESLIKLEPMSGPSSPMDSAVMQEQQSTAQSVPSTFPQHLQAKARAIYIRTQSQDSLTRTKNPVLPSIHAESSLVVPEPNLVKYPVNSQDAFSLDFGEDRENSLTDLRGQLFLSEDYGPNIFQPWNC